MLFRSNKYDIGLAFYAPTSVNVKHALPNKFFEYVQSRLAVVTGPSPEMSTLVERYGFGAVSDTFSTRDLAETLNRLDAGTIHEYKMASDAVAPQLCLEREKQVLFDVVDEIHVS